MFKKSEPRSSSRRRTMGLALARPLNEAEMTLVAGAGCGAGGLSYPPVAPTMCDPHEN